MVQLLDRIFQSGSIRQAALAKGMSYRTAWQMVRKVERIVGKPVLQRLVGGARGGGSHPSEAGMTVLRRYRRVEALANKAAKKELSQLLSLTANKKRRRKS